MHKFFKLLILIITLNLTIYAKTHSQDTSVKNSTLSQSMNNSTLETENYFIADKPLFTITGTKIQKKSKIKPIPLAIFSATYVGVFTLQHILQLNTIWKNLGEFHIMEDKNYALNVDKFGHFYGAFLSSYVLSQTLLECGLSYNWAMGVGAFLGLGYSTYVEILDGFAVEWGFSPSDFYSDLAGGLFFLGYAYLPFFQNFTPKFMYLPPKWFNSHSRKPSKMFIDDYSAHTFWISLNVYNLLPQNLKKFYPKWLDISIGYAARNLCFPLDTAFHCDPNISEPVLPYVWGNQKIIIALDYDLVKLLPDGPPFWNWLKQSLNYFKLPSPALEIGKEIRFYLLYPFPVNLGKLKF
ncbi:MAG: YfiM family protein [Ignavibacteria bacterium]|nr:YfiM family protein [Ignavibacteria bacterium]